MRPVLPALAAVGTAAAVLLALTPAAQAATPAVQFVKVYYDSPGSDLRSNASLNGEYVVIKNTTTKAINLGGWAISDKTGYKYAFQAGVALKPGKTYTLRTGTGNDGSSGVYWNRRAYVWNNDKDTAYVRRSDGKLIDSCPYNSTRADYTNC